MTTHDDNLVAQEQVGFPELYRFAFGNEVEYYTSWPKSLTFNAHLYLAAPIKRSGFTMDSQYKAMSLSVVAPPTLAFQRYLASAPASVTQVTIYRAVEDDLTEYVILFNGYVKSVSFSNQQAQAECISNSNILDNLIPEILYQSYCNHTVFDDGCGLAESSWRLQLNNITVSVDGDYIQDTQLGSYAEDYFGLGVASSIDGEFMRFITRHDYANDRVYLHIPFSSSEVVTGDNIYVYPGCDGSPATCVDRFNNLLKFLGMPYIPSNNPVMWAFCQPVKP